MKFAPKLTALFIGIDAIIAAVMFTIVYFQVAKILESEIRARMENRVFFTMDALDRSLYERLSDIKMIAEDLVISSENATAEQITERLIFFRNAYKCYASLSFFNLERIRIADTTGLQLGQQNRIERYWEDVLAGQVSAAGDVSMSDTLNMPIIYFASVVKNKEGKAIGVVVTRVPVTRLFEMVKGSAKIPEEEEEEIDLINKDGLLIYSNHNREGILKENLPEWESIKIAQQEKIFGSTKHRHAGEKETMHHVFCLEQGHLDFKGNGWTIIFHVPTRVIFGPVKKLLVILIVMFLVMLPGLALIIHLFSKTVTRPLARLSFAAAEIGKGKLDTVIEVKSKDEFGPLADTFNQMAGDLKKTTTSIDSLNKEITERKRVEEMLSYFQKAVDSASDAIGMSTPEGRHYYQNEAFAKLFGLSVNEVDGASGPPATIYADEKVGRKVFDTIMRGGSFTGEVKMLAEDKSKKDIFLRAYSIKDEEGKVIGLVGIHTDITERKRVEGVLKDSEERYRTAIECSNDGVAFMKGDFHLYVNQKFLEMFGYNHPEEIIGKPLSVVVHPDDRDRVMEINLKRQKGENVPSKYELKGIRKNGDIIYVEVSATKTTYRGETVSLAYLRDITERKRAGEVLRKSEERFRELYDNVPVGYFEYDTQGRITSINRTELEMLGYAFEEMIGQPVWKFIVEEEIVRQQILAKLAGTMPPARDLERTYQRKDGTTFPVIVEDRLILDSEGKIKGIRATIQDITERKQAEGVLRESEERSRSLIETSPDVIVLIDFSGKIIVVNEVALTTYGYESRDELIGKSILDFVIPEDQPRVLQEISKVLEVKTLRNLEYTSLKKDGSAFSIEVSASLILDAQQKPTSIVIIIRDITERKRAELQRLRTLEHQERLNQLQQVLLAPGDMEQKLKMITDGVVDIFAADFCRIWIIGSGDLCELGCMHAVVTEGPHICLAKDKCLRLIASSGRYTHIDGAVHRRVPFGAYKIGRVASGEEHKFLSNDVTHDLRIHNHDWAKELGLVSFTGYQLRPPGGETLGVLALFSQHPITPEEDAQLDALGNTTAQVIRAGQVEEALSASEERYRTLFEGAAEGILVADIESKQFKYVNPATCRMLGYTAEELTRLSLADIHPKEALDYVLAEFEAQARGEKTLSPEIPCLRKDGSVIYTSIVTAPVVIDGRKYNAGFFTDITERKRATTELVNLNKQLEAAKEAAEAGSRAKSEFLASMSHEIRTPLNAVIGMLGLLSTSELNGPHREYVEIARSSADGLLAIIGDILDFSKIEAGKLFFELVPFDLLRVVEETIDMMVMKTREKGLDLTVQYGPDVPRHLIGDSGRIRQVLINLVNNAIKFTHKGHVIIDVRAEEPMNEEVLLRITVEDTGIGIPSDKLDSLFEPFTQADASTTRRYGGTGLGLAISKRLVEVMGGTIGASSRMGEGSAFWFTLCLPLDKEFTGVAAPMAEKIALHPPAESGATQSALPKTALWGRPLRVLVVEDNVVNQRVTLLMLTELGCHVDLAANGREAVEMVELLPLDMVFMDCEMPEMDGFEATREIRRLQGDKRLPIIAMTAYALQGDRERCLAAGMDDYFSKPVKLEDFQAALERWGPKDSRSFEGRLKPPASLEKAPRTVENETSSVIDPNVIARLRGLADATDPSLLMRIFHLFLSDTPERITTLREAVATGDTAGLSKAAHSLRGACASIGVMGMVEICKTLESFGQGKYVDGAMALVEKLETEFNQVKVKIEREIADDRLALLSTASKKDENI